jgi:hypothetical protein
MRTLARFDAPEDGYLLRSFLASRGIASTVLDEHVAQLFWHYRQATGGVRVVIADDEDWPEAENACREYMGNRGQDVAVVPPARCWPLVLLLSWAIGGPLLLFGRKNRRL